MGLVLKLLNLKLQVSSCKVPVGYLSTDIYKVPVLCWTLCTGSSRIRLCCPRVSRVLWASGRGVRD